MPFFRICFGVGVINSEQFWKSGWFLTWFYSAFGISGGFEHPKPSSVRHWHVLYWIEPKICLCEPCDEEMNYTMSEFCHYTSVQLHKCHSTNSQYSYSIRIFGPGRSVSIATELRAGRSGIESGCGWGYPPFHTNPEAHQAYCKIDTGSIPAVKCGWGLLLTTHNVPVPRSCKSRAITLPKLWATPGL